MKQIAIDVVLFPEKEMIQKAIDLNREIARPNNPLFSLGYDSCIPHITLAMGSVYERDLDKVKDIVTETSSNYSVVEMIAKGFRQQKLRENKPFMGIRLNENPNVRSMYLDVMDSLKPFFHYNASKEMFANPKDINQLTIEWVNAWKHKQSDSYHPHLSLGFGNIVKQKFPFGFKADRIAISQLGNYCTCQKILYKAALLR